MPYSSDTAYFIINVHGRGLKNVWVYNFPQDVMFVCLILVMLAVIVVKDVLIIARDPVCETPMTPGPITNDTGLNSFISWVVDLNDRNHPFITNILIEASQ